MKKLFFFLVFILLFSMAGCSAYDTLKLRSALTDEIYHQDNLEYMAVGYSVYKIENRYSVIIYDSNGAVGKVDFSAERVVIDVIGVRPITIENMRDLLNLSFDEVTDKFGEAHLDNGSGFYIPSYISTDGYLFCFRLSDSNEVVGISKWDIFHNACIDTIWK